MPQYDFRCLKCKKAFALNMTMAEYGRRKHKCPKCRSTRVQRQLTGFFAQTKKKS
ncbi:MAG: FmdB family zinc ribbon protein [Gemmatimonadota bacterium]